MTAITGGVPRSTERKHVITYWLMPAKPERDLFCELIRILCKQFNAPLFDPHVTLLTTEENRQSPQKAVQEILAAPIRLAIRDVAFSSEFSKTLFVRLRPSKPLQNLILALGRAAKSRAKRLADPHVSLLYKTLASKVQKELAATIKLPLVEATFDSISAVRSPSPVETAADVQAWKILAKKSLRR